MASFQISSTRREELIDITAGIDNAAAQSKIANGICVVYVPHTTAAVTINENADPTVIKDMLAGLSHLKLESLDFAHSEGNSPAHIKSSLIGCSVTVIVKNGRLQLGTWQGIFFCEFDGPRTRTVTVQCIGS